jgi:hypothetical protein
LFKETAMSNIAMHDRTVARAPARPVRDRQRVLRWAALILLLLSAAVAAARA